MTSSSFDVRDIHRLFGGAPFPWWVAGGRGLELFLGRRIRLHEDLDVAVLRPDEAAIRRHLDGWDLHVASRSGLVPWVQPLASAEHALWCRPSAGEPWAFELLFSPVEGDAWVFRRDGGVRLPLGSVGARTDQGIPYLAPEVVLLFKAKQVRARDQQDFDAVAPALDGRARDWLRDAIGRADPDHPWISRLA